MKKLFAVSCVLFSLTACTALQKRVENMTPQEKQDMCVIATETVKHVCKPAE